ncbi:MAG: DUF1616 domain-containing protein [Thermoplasmata archaeon]|nr:DUF1616 domain-containing protein [Thermoplasmata archaeon]
MSVNPAEAFAGFLLVFFLPGFAVTRAVFPEWRLRGALAIERAVETATLSLVTSVALTILIGFALLQSPSGFQASWSDPLLELCLGAVTFLGLVVGWWRGAYRREPPATPAPEPAPGDSNAWETLRDLEANARERRRLAHALRRTPPGSREAEELEERRRALEVKSEELRRAREAEYAG